MVRHGVTLLNLQSFTSLSVPTHACMHACMRRCDKKLIAARSLGMITEQNRLPRVENKEQKQLPATHRETTLAMRGEIHNLGFGKPIVEPRRRTYQKKD